MGTGDDIELGAVVHGVGTYTVLALVGIHWRSRLWEQAEVRESHTPSHIHHSTFRQGQRYPSSLSLPNQNSPGIQHSGAHTHPWALGRKSEESHQRLSRASAWRTHLSRCSGLMVHHHSHDKEAQGESMFPPLAPCSQPALPCPYPAGLTYHRNKLDSISQAHARSSLRIPTNTRGVQLYIVWCHTLKAEQECSDQDGSHNQNTTHHCIAWVQASVEPTRPRPCSRGSWPDSTATTITLSSEKNLSPPTREWQKASATVGMFGYTGSISPSGLRMAPMPRGWPYYMK